MIEDADPEDIIIYAELISVQNTASEGEIDLENKETINNLNEIQLSNSSIVDLNSEGD